MTNAISFRVLFSNTSLLAAPPIEGLIYSSLEFMRQDIKLSQLSFTREDTKESGVSQIGRYAVPLLYLLCLGLTANNESSPNRRVTNDEAGAYATLKVQGMVCEWRVNREEQYLTHCFQGKMDLYLYSVRAISIST